MFITPFTVLPHHSDSAKTRTGYLGVLFHKRRRRKPGMPGAGGERMVPSYLDFLSII